MNGVSWSQHYRLVALAAFIACEQRNAAPRANSQEENKPWYQSGAKFDPGSGQQSDPLTGIGMSFAGSEWVGYRAPASDGRSVFVRIGQATAKPIAAICMLGFAFPTQLMRRGCRSGNP